MDIHISFLFIKNVKRERFYLFPKARSIKYYFAHMFVCTIHHIVFVQSSQLRNRASGALTQLTRTYNNYITSSYYALFELCLRHDERKLRIFMWAKKIFSVIQYL